MNVLIIENLPDQRKLLSDILESLDDVQIAGFTDSIKATVDWFINHKEPDLIFISTQLEDGSATDLFKEARITSPLVFMASDEKMAIHAFKYNAIDYLKRPIKKNGIISAIYKYRGLKDILAKSPDLAPGSGDPSRFNPLNIQKEYKNRFALFLGDKIKTLEVKDIAYFRADGNVVYLTSTQGDRFTINYTLEEISEQLDGKIFFRLNRTFIIHYQAIKEIRRYFNGRLKIWLNPDPDEEEEVFVSRNRVSEFLTWLGE